MSEERADAMAATVRQLALKAQNVARDLDPSVSLCVRIHIYTCRYECGHWIACQGYLAPSKLSHFLLSHNCPLSYFGPQNEFQYLRIKTKKHEVIAAIGR